MSFFQKLKSKSKEDLERKQDAELKQKQREEEIKVAMQTVHQYAKELGFRSQELDTRFYNHLFSILVDYKHRIAELEKQISEKG